MLMNSVKQLEHEMQVLCIFSLTNSLLSGCTLEINTPYHVGEMKRYFILALLIEMCIPGRGKSNFHYEIEMKDTIWMKKPDP